MSVQLENTSSIPQNIENEEFAPREVGWKQFASSLFPTNWIGFLGLFLNPKHEVAVDQSLKDFLIKQGLEGKVRFYSSEAVPALLRDRFTCQASAIGCQDFDLVCGGPFVIIGTAIPQEAKNTVIKHEIAHIKHNDLAHRSISVAALLSLSIMAFYIFPYFGMITAIVGMQLLNVSRRSQEAAADALAFEHSTIRELVGIRKFFDSFDEEYKDLEKSHPSINHRIEQIDFEIQRKLSEVI